jgi:ATP-dependent DNA ligase
MDGAYYRFIKDMDGNMRLQGRSKSVNGGYLDKLDHVPHLMKLFDELPNGTCLLGEIYFPNNEGSSNVTTIMGCLTDKAIARQEKGNKLHYYIFDVWAFEGESWMDKKCEDRFDELNALSRAYPNEFVEWAQYYEGKELWTQLQTILANGGEGIVMTKKGTVPQPGKRPARKTLKVKKELAENIDCFFTGRYTSPTRLYSGKELETWKYWVRLRDNQKLEGLFYENYKNGEAIEPVTKPYFNDWAGSLEIAVLRDGVETPIGFLSGLSDEIKANPKDMRHRCIEVAAMEVLSTGGIRHGKLKQFRPDLTYLDCTWEKAFG